MTSGALFIVATPIGNLGDITKRALELLTVCDLVVAEDTRHSSKLLQHYSISKPMLSLHMHNESERVGKVLAEIESGKKVILVSDAGTPLISDPGYVLVKAARESNCPVYAVPGPCALIAALSVSGLPSDNFSFEGFIPTRGQAKTKALEDLGARKGTSIFYESSHRIRDTISQLAELFPEREICIARELTKQYETVRAGPAQEIYEWLLSDDNQSKGEFVVMVSPMPVTTVEVSEEQTALLDLLLVDLPPKKACSIVAKHYGSDKKALYKIAIEKRT